MAALAAVLLTAPAAGCGEVQRPTASTVLADSADQVVYGLNHLLTVEGVLRTRLQAATARFYQATQSADLDSVKVTFYSPEGRETSTLTARGGKYDWRSGNMEARGNVVAVTPDGRRLRTSVLLYRRHDQAIEGPNDFVFDAPGQHLEGEGFTSDPDFRNVVTRKPRRGTMGQLEMER